MKSSPFLNKLLHSQFAGLPTRFQHSQFANVHLQRHEDVIRQSVSTSSDRWGQEVPTLLKNQHVFSIVSLQVQLQTCVNIQLQTRGGQEVPTLFGESVRQSACVSSGRGGQPLLKNQHVFSAVSLYV